MGGYGGSSGKTKGKCYYDTGGHKVKDQNAIDVAERYISEGSYVAFLKEKPPEKRPDLSVDGEFLVEVKGMTSTSPNRVAKNIKEAFSQILSELSHYPEDEQHPGKVIILSRHDNFTEGYNAALEGYHLAKAQGYVHGMVEFWHGDNIFYLD